MRKSSGQDPKTVSNRVLLGCTVLAALMIGFCFHYLQQKSVPRNNVSSNPSKVRQRISYPQNALPAYSDPLHIFFGRTENLRREVQRKDPIENISNCIECLCSVLLDKEAGYELRERAAQKLFDSDKNTGIAGILTVILASNWRSDCAFNAGLVKLLRDSGCNERLVGLLQRLGCGPIGNIDIDLEDEGLIQHYFDASSATDILARALAYAYSSNSDPDSKQKSSLVKTPYLRAVDILEAEVDGEEERMGSELNILLSSQESLGSLFFLARESRTESNERMQLSLSDWMARYRFVSYTDAAIEESLKRYLHNPGATYAEQALAKYGLENLYASRLAEK
jgi:hypothetical protein